MPQAAELRTRLRDADATFRVVKNSLTERAADEVGADALKALLEGPTALTFVRGDAALAAKALQTFRRETEKLEFKGGLLGAEALDAEQILALARLPARDVLYGQLVGVVASPITGLVRGAERADRRPRPPARADRREEGERRDPGGRAARAPAAAAEPSRPRLRPRRPLRPRQLPRRRPLPRQSAPRPRLRCRGGGSAPRRRLPPLSRRLPRRPRLAGAAEETPAETATEEAAG